MPQIDYTDESEKTERRSPVPNKLRFDRSISLGTLITILGGLITALIAYKGVVGKLDHIERAAVKADIMWEHFQREHTDISADDLRALR